jgi:CDP-glucose 4,6-dehydratase
VEGKPGMENLVMLNSLEIYKGKKVLVTGHTGFKGSWLSLWLKSLGADIIGISLDPATERDNFILSNLGHQINDYRADIRNYQDIEKIVLKEQPEVLFHLAAQPIVLDSYENPVYTYETNVMGTINLLELFRKVPSFHTGVFITTDKCYDNKEWVYGYRETDPMGGFDPYSSSKGAAELAISSYRNSFFHEKNKNIASVRAGNVIGGGDWSPFRIVVDLVNAIEQNKPLEIRSPLAVRPWQHVLEPLGGYLLLGAKMMNEPGAYTEAWNFGPEQQNICNVKTLVSETINQWGQGEWKDVSANEGKHEAKLLSLDISKARFHLNWQPVLDLQKTIEYTVDWYKNYKSTDVNELCLSQIENYSYLWKLRSEN